MRQFKIERSDRRYKASVAVKISATDTEGRTLEQELTTVDVSKRGAHLKGIRGKLRVGGEVSLTRLNKREQFRVAWVGEANTARAGQIGVAANDAASSFWNDVVEQQERAVAA